MVCIYCGGSTKVTNSRQQKRLHQVWRRRACEKCGALFTTNEIVDFSTSLVVKTGARNISPFSRDRLFASILGSVGHREASVADAGGLTATIVSKLLGAAKSAVLTREDIISTSLQVLKHFDGAAAVQYAAYHKTVRH